MFVRTDTIIYISRKTSSGCFPVCKDGSANHGNYPEFSDTAPSFILTIENMAHGRAYRFTGLLQACRFTGLKVYRFTGLQVYSGFTGFTGFQVPRFPPLNGDLGRRSRTQI